MKLTIVEKFFTVSGEAPIPGKPVYLIRFSGCNLDCTYCDTAYRDEINFTYTPNELIADITAAIQQYPAANVLFTGGEPLLGERQSVLEDISVCFQESNFYIETNGSIKITGTSHENIHYVVDWKLPSSGYGESFNHNNLTILRPKFDCIKLVVAKSDLPEIPVIINTIKRLNRALPVYLSPQWGNISFEELAEFIITNRLDASLSLQLHKIIWGNKRGV